MVYCANFEYGECGYWLGAIRVIVAVVALVALVSFVSVIADSVASSARPLVPIVAVTHKYLVRSEDIRHRIIGRV